MCPLSIRPSSVSRPHSSSRSPLMDSAQASPTLTIIQPHLPTHSPLSHAICPLTRHYPTPSSAHSLTSDGSSSDGFCTGPAGAMEKSHPWHRRPSWRSNQRPEGTTSLLWLCPLPLLSLPLSHRPPSADGVRRRCSSLSSAAPSAPSRRRPLIPAMFGCPAGGSAAPSLWGAAAAAPRLRPHRHLWPGEIRGAPQLIRARPHSTA